MSNAFAHFAQTVTSDGLKIFVQHWPTSSAEPKGIALLVHGLGEHIGRYHEVAQQLNQAGWAVVGYDHRGHGQSEGPRGRLNHQDDLLNDLALIVDTARSAYPGLQLALIGHSMGGLLAARFVAGLQQKPKIAPWQRSVELCVLSSPAFDLGLSMAQKILLNTVGKWLPNVAVSNGLDPNGVCNDPAVVQAYRLDPLVHDRISGRFTWFMRDALEFVHAQASAWPIPTLLLYAGADQLVPPAGSDRFAKAALAAKVQSKKYPHMAHEIFLEPDRAKVFHDMLSWLSQH